MKRALRWVLWGLGGAIALVLILVLAAWGASCTRPGGRWLAGFVEGKAAEALLGDAHVRSIRLCGARLSVEGLSVNDAEGEPVAKVKRVDVRIAPLALLSNTISVKRVYIDTPEVWLRQQDGVWNFSRVAKPSEEEEEPAAADEGEGDWKFELADFRLDRGSIRLRDGDSGRRVSLTGLDIESKGAYAAEAAQLELLVKAQAEELLTGPVHLELFALKKGAEVEGKVNFRAAASELRAEGRLDDKSGHVELASLVLSPALGRAAVPSYPVRLPISAQGKAEKRGDDLRADMAFSSGSARAAIEGAANLAASKGQVSLDARALNFSQLLEGGPKSNVDISFHASGQGKSVEAMSGEAKLSIPPSRVEGVPFGPVRAQVLANRGEFRLAEFLANMPGLKLEASGTGSTREVDLNARLEAEDLDLFARTLGKLLPIPVGGKGELSVTAKGPTRSPGVEARAEFPKLRVADTFARGLSVAAKLPNATQPLTGKVDFKVDETKLGETSFTAFRTQLNGTPSDYRLSASTQGTYPFNLRAEGTLVENHMQGTIDVFELLLGDQTWRLSRQAHWKAEEPTMELTDFALASGLQQLALSGQLKKDVFSASASLQKFNLAGLPRLIKPLKSYALAGELNAELKAEGKTSKPRAIASVEWVEGGIRKLTGISVDAQVKYDGDVAKGALKGTMPNLDLASEFNLPLKPLASLRGRAPVSASVKGQANIGELIRQLEVQTNAAGNVSLDGQLSGTAGAPKLTVLVEGEHLRYQTSPELAVNGKLQADEGSGTRLSWKVDGAGRALELQAKLAAGLAKLWHQRERPRTLAQTAMELTGKWEEFPLALLSQAGLVQTPLAGEVSGKIDMRGPLASPKGTAQLRAEKPLVGEYRMSAAEAKLSLHDKAVTFDARADTAQGPLVTLAAKVGASLGELQTQRLQSVPVEAKVKLGPAELEDLRTLKVRAQGRQQAPLPIWGRLSGDLLASGTVKQPEVKANIQLTGLGNEENHSGHLGFDYSYAKANHALNVAVRSPSGGQLLLDAKAEYDVTKTPASTDGPLQAKLSAQDFSPHFLVDVTPKLRELDGLLRGEVRVGGKVSVPEVEGQLEWKDGALHYDGYTPLRQIHLAMGGSPVNFRLEDFSANAVDGKVQLKGELKKEGEQLSIRANSELSEFPVMVEDQLLATVSLRADAQGQARGPKMTLDRVQIPEVQLVLPDVQRKNLQKLSVPDDIVLVRNGQPIPGQKRPQTPEEGTGGSGEAEAQGLEFLAHLYAPKNIWVKGNDLNIELGLSEDFRVRYDHSQSYAFGTVNVLRGRMDVFGRRFDVERDSKVRFSGAVDAPQLNVTAIHKNEREEVTVRLGIEGKPGSLAIKPTSEPPLSESEIYTLLATGRTSLRRGGATTSPAGQAASVVGSLAASQLKETLSENLPLDVLSIEAGDQGVEGSKLEAGTYVNDRLYIGFTGRIGADPMKGENSNQINLEYQLSKRWNAEASYGDARAGGLDFVWTKEY